MLVFLNSWGEINKNGFGLDCFSLNLDCRPRHLWTLNFLFMNFGDSWSAVANPTVPLAICADEWRLDGQPAGATVVDAVVGFDFAEWLSWIRQSCLPPMHFVAASFFCFFFHLTQFAINQSMYLDVFLKNMFLVSFTSLWNSNQRYWRWCLCRRALGWCTLCSSFTEIFSVFPSSLCSKNDCSVWHLLPIIGVTPAMLPASRPHMLRRILMASWIWEDKKAWSFSKPETITMNTLLTMAKNKTKTKTQK